MKSIEKKEFKTIINYETYLKCLDFADFITAEPEKAKDMYMHYVLDFCALRESEDNLFQYIYCKLISNNISYICDNTILEDIEDIMAMVLKHAESKEDMNKLFSLFSTLKHIVNDAMN